MHITNVTIIQGPKIQKKKLWNTLLEESHPAPNEINSHHDMLEMCHVTSMIPQLMKSDNFSLIHFAMLHFLFIKFNHAKWKIGIFKLCDLIITHK